MLLCTGQPLPQTKNGTLSKMSVVLWLKNPNLLDHSCLLCLCDIVKGLLLTFQLDVSQRACDSFLLAATEVGAAGTGGDRGEEGRALAVGVCFLT